MNCSKILFSIIVIMGFFTISAGAAITDPGTVNKIIGDIGSPIINPGGQGAFSFSVNNRENRSMENIRLNVSIYLYATIDESQPVTEMENPPIIEVDGEFFGSDYNVPVFDLGPNQSVTINFNVVTERHIPHGGIFSQSTYFIRFWLEFVFEDVNYTMISRGYINDDDWRKLDLDDGDGSGINRTYLAEMGFDGLLPDSSFTLYTPLPGWPFYILIITTIGTAALAINFYILDNPGKYPRLEKRLQKYGGKFNQFRRLQKRHLGSARRKVDVPRREKKGD